MSDTPPLHHSTIAAVLELREKFPRTPFLTLGQTVLWDEPTKAAFCAILEEMEKAEMICPDSRIIAGVHDTDYFAKLEGLAIRDVPFAVLRHSDGDTRGLWSAAGEISALFGSEIVPSRASFIKEGVSFAKAAKAYPGGAEVLLNQETDAPLWRAIVHTEPHPLIAAEVKLEAIEPALREQLSWAFRHSLQSMGCPDDFEGDHECPSRDIARKIWGWNDEYLARNPKATLSDLYRHLIPKTWALVRGEAACNLETTASLDLFRFNALTAGKPRFGFVDHFLNPATRDLACKAYDDAVRGSGIYTLDQFGPGALPFDVVIPGKGRGTLRLHEGSVFVETEEPIEICENCDPSTLGQLAALLQGHFGPDICLVGKAVALISMLSAEYIFLFHEKASSYTSRTQHMNAQLRTAGVELPLHPMLRLQYSTWDALHDVEAEFKLPPHLAKAFGVTKISARDFAARWKSVANESDERRHVLASCKGPRALMEKLAEWEGPRWREKRDAYETASQTLAEARVSARAIRHECVTLRVQARKLIENALKLEKVKGESYRTEIAPVRTRISDLKEAASLRLNPVDDNGKPRRLTKEERTAQAEMDRLEQQEISELRNQIVQKTTVRVEIDRKIADLRTQVRSLKGKAKGLVADLSRFEKSPDLQQARQTRQQLESEAELQRLLLVRNAIIASDGLHSTNYRPTAWWLPMISPDGKWFRNITQTTQARIEVL